MPVRRTRIRIGSGGLLYLVVSLVVLSAGWYTQANLLFWGFGLMVGGLVFSVGMAALALRGLEVTRLLPSHTAAGESMALRYRLHNRSWLPMFGLIVREAWGPRSRSWRKVGPASRGERMLGGPPQAWVVHLAPLGTTQAQAPCRPRRRGVLRFERLEVSTSFPFGVFHKTILMERPAEVLVFPPLYRLRRQLLTALSAHDGDGGRPLSRAGTHGEFFGVREYRPGDSPRTIDWKRTARTGTLVARELTTPRAPRLNLVLDLREPPPISIHPRPRPRKGDRPRKGERALFGKASSSGNSSALGTQGWSTFAWAWRFLRHHLRPAAEEAEDGATSSAEMPLTPARPLTAADLEERAISLAASLVCEGYLRGLRVGLKIIGPESLSFRPRHSLPHRTRLLETLSRLELSRRDPLRLDPARGSRADAIVWAGRGTALTAPGRRQSPGAGGGGGAGGPVTLVLGAMDFDQYVLEPAGLATLSSGPATIAPAMRSFGQPGAGAGAGGGSGAARPPVGEASALPREVVA